MGHRTTSAGAEDAHDDAPGGSPAGAGRHGTHAERLGRHLRAVRRRRGLTLVQLAALAGLSHPFLSQVERGVARPSMVSLESIAHALGTSQLELMAGAADLERPPADASPSVVRAGTGDVGPYGRGSARLLVRGDRRFHPMVFDGATDDPGPYFTHDEDEFVHVVAGECVVDLGPQGDVDLAEGDSLYYPGGTPHRWSSPTASPYRLFVVKQGLAVRPAAPVSSVRVEPARAVLA